MSDNGVVEVMTGSEPEGSVIWLHGLGADGHDFEPIVPELHLPDSMSVRFVFPHAPVRPVTLNGGMAMRAWYDIVSLDREGRADADGVRESAATVQQLHEREIDRGVAADRVVIAGFSQGGAVAIHYAMHATRPLAGLMALSTYMAVPPDESVHGNADLPIFMAHGRDDPMVPCNYGQASAERLQELGYRVDWHDYPMMHAVCPQEIADIREWLLSVFGA